MPHPVIEALSIGKPQISWFVNQPYRLQPTVPMASIPVMVKLAVAAPPPAGMISISTLRKPFSSENVCLNVYQPEVSMHW